MKLNNREEIVTNLAAILKEYNKHPRNYQTDIYLYIDEETGDGELYEFPNPGGNSWLDDDHYTLYTLKQTFDNPLYIFFDTIDLIADVLGMTKEVLVQMVAEDTDMDAEDVDWTDVMGYVGRHDNLEETLEAYYDEYYDEWIEDDAADLTETIVSNFEDKS